MCDPWWENETAWHRAWKDHFPVDWQEVVHHSKTGERHIADVKTGDGWVIEFQHSHIKPEERRSREAFYERLIWVVDGTRRKRDKPQLLRAWQEGVPITTVLRRAFSDDCGALQDWAGSSARLFIDLGESEVLWYVFHNTSGATYIHPVLRTEFIEWHRRPATEIARQFEILVSELPGLVAAYESRPRAQPVMRPPMDSRWFRRRPRL